MANLNPYVPFGWLIVLWVFSSQATSSSALDSSSRTLKITTVVSKPFMMVKEKGSGNDLYEGFIPDLLKELSKQLNFKYEIRLAKDGKYGTTVNTTYWSGVVGEVMRREADVGALDLTITRARMQIVDFTVPFMTSGIGILMKKNPAPVMQSGFFLKPFATDVWICILVAMLGTSVVFFFLARFNGSEWVNLESSERQNNLTVSNVLYFTLASLTFQNSTIAPRGISTRILSAFWWIFCFIILSSYIANLAALIVARIDQQVLSESINSVEDLSKQTKVKYGTIASGSTYAFFEKSQLPLYQFMYSEMMNMDPQPFVTSFAEGVQKVKDEDYALFSEHTSISYLISKDCDLRAVGGLLDYKGYGLALKKGDAFVEILSGKIMELQEKGVLHSLREKWWGKNTEGGCSEVENEDFSSLPLHSINGLFIILIVGAIVSVVIGAVELVWRVKASREEGGMCTEITRELTFAFCGGSNPGKNDKRNNHHDDGIILERQETI